jgi:PD-(D/E)XK nuclease superfamily protein
VTLDLDTFPRFDLVEGIAFNLPITHWSPSSFAMLQRCPEQFRCRYVLKRKERPAEATFVGTTIHHAVEMNFRQKIASHEDIILPTILEYYVDSFPILLEMEQEQRGDEILWDTDAEKARTRGKAMLAGYQNYVAPRIQPVAVETKISVDLGMAVPVEGRFDVERDESVIDLKSGKQARKRPKEDWLIQSVVYGTERAKPVEFHTISASPGTNKVTIYTPLESEALLVNPSPEERAQQIGTLRALSDMACHYMAIYGPDEPWPTLGRFHSWACDYCGFRKDCPAWRGTT